jgi:rhodanese-related sulfurtransferase
MSVTARVEWTAIDFHAKIEYDDATRQITTTATGGATPVFDLQTVQVTPTVSRTIAYYPQAGVQSRNAALAAAMAGADFQVIQDGSVSVLATNITPAQLQRIVGKTAGGVDGMLSGGQWSTF